ncbi:hypothetical protein [Alteraurantiacibacter aquimixticola]|uniref:Uncharacterized protein n=1 Tax=Alteraurantiacibacter aquimixticola TaxID=2489173 RepID=A0A4T3F002_9SPHN|nr:hypothetical protein [Alteraurantiacibacter aquimixticola]TIX50234.1 hypothetical protein E5222_08075 [Alteraurantiacibacter aquimixticola]
MALAPLPVLAQEDVTDTTPSVMDVAMTPLSDLNLAKDPIPQVLLTARAAPYAGEGLNSCTAIRSEIGNLDAVLGDDFDTASPDEREFTPTGVAQRVVGMFIPFRGIIREISGANSHEYQFREAIAAGLMRRAYLKGKGQEMGCPYPASPAPPELVARLNAMREGAADASGQVVTTADDGTQFVSRPVVQGSR